MTDEELQSYLDDNGYPPHVVEGGRPGLIRRYREFVAEVERGYDYSLQSYRNDLDGRALIHMAEADDDVADEDQRLSAALSHTEVRVWESSAGDPFWDFGYPANARGTLLRHLIGAGLITEESLHERDQT